MSLSARIQSWLQDRDGRAFIFVGNRISDLRFYGWRFVTSEGRRSSRDTQEGT